MGGKVRRKAIAHSTGGSLISDDKLQQMYARMLQCRMLTEYAQPTPSARLYRGSMGQEAIACGCVIDLRPDDTIVVAPHDSTARLVKGVEISELVKELQERPTRNNLDMKFSMALDAAVRSKKKKHGNVVVAFADKATAKLSSWKQMMEMAGKAKLPMLFVVENNPWPAPARIRTSAPQTFSFPVFTVDANDVVAVYRVAYECLERVRIDPCPVLIEAIPYRLPHERDPLLHMERYLKAKKLFSVPWKKQVAQQFKRALGSNHRASRPPAND